MDKNHKSTSNAERVSFWLWLFAGFTLSAVLRSEAPDGKRLAIVLAFWFVWCLFALVGFGILECIRRGWLANAYYPISDNIKKFNHRIAAKDEDKALVKTSQRYFLVYGLPTAAILLHFFAIDWFGSRYRLFRVRPGFSDGTGTVLGFVVPLAMLAIEAYLILGWYKRTKPPGS